MYPYPRSRFSRFAEWTAHTTGHPLGSAAGDGAWGRHDGSEPSQRPDRTYDLSLSGGMMNSTTWTINGKSFPNTDGLQVRNGERVRIRLSNMSMQDHPMHLHGDTFQMVGADGRAIDGPFKDTLTVRPMERYEIEFVATDPGTWLFHCYNLA
jgi:FtsP/CotA-like multicopper oxidase with cupredoxin domain